MTSLVSWSHPWFTAVKNVYRAYLVNNVTIQVRSLK